MTRFIALLPAAGSGSRMATDTPKQYLPLLGKPLLVHTLFALACSPEIDQVVLVLSPEDEWFDSTVDNACLGNELGSKLTVLRCGGDSRAETVRNGLMALTSHLAADDWVLVHDAARPCLQSADVSRLIATLRDDPVGGLLALPIADTIKRADKAERITATVPRDALWRAQTPQMFRHGMLLNALQNSADGSVTDEASALEAQSLAPRLVMGDERNIKVTYPADLALAALYLQAAQPG
ncbi:2-C-methyl-D-erythritol 4-phosphate cytidylyltransferase [Chitinimonas sp. BJB300]|uniref:2-C-methyl-D-erythritol 4-phosphate cytidylyltransferase n=1 Tax=Chitinimonas sp. BJB300 TaxID=1559339 RepID=UPI000C0D8BC0|nr:2-C-methyl-D-erythritol 4-phosphate cytidylyltransferase [Chitinimonas sp. BJB300]PHV13466.1 2-C-methyl-D-erythritol 4-phosphate cytidylyltransferase [Chitinimonas sp. BJB300]TSJ89849.1 2-C-methyl-D-erythritol 4-phosphate cytidylyltransferase [Chitinimonas sp. BJB300]